MRGNSIQNITKILSQSNFEPILKIVITFRLSRLHEVLHLKSEEYMTRCRDRLHFVDHAQKRTPTERKRTPSDVYSHLYLSRTVDPSLSCFVDTGIVFSTAPCVSLTQKTRVLSSCFFSPDMQIGELCATAAF